MTSTQPTIQAAIRLPGLAGHAIAADLQGATRANRLAAHKRQSPRTSWSPTEGQPARQNPRTAPQPTAIQNAGGFNFR